MYNEQKFYQEIIEGEYWKCFLDNNTDVELLLREREFDEELMYLFRFDRFPVPVNGITMKNGDWNWEITYE